MYYTFNENIHTHACIYILPTTPPHPHHGEGWRKTDPKGTCSLPSAIYWWECAVSLRHLSFKPTWLTLVRIYLAMENISAWAWVTDSLEFIYHWLSYQLLVCDNPTCLLFEDQCLYSRGSNHSLILTGGGIPWDGGLSYIYLKSQNPHENGTRSWMKNHMTAKTSEQQIGLPFFQRVFGKQPGEIRNASMKDCISGPSRNFATQHISQTWEESGDTTAFSHPVQGQHARP